jgi:hypothetical protein
VQAAAIAELDLRDVIQVDSWRRLARKKRRGSSFASSAASERASSGPLAAPEQAHVVALGAEQADFAQRHEPAAMPVA